MKLGSQFILLEEDNREAWKEYITELNKKLEEAKKNERSTN